MAKGRTSAQTYKGDPLVKQYVQTSTWVRDRSRPLLTYLTIAAVVIALALMGWLFYSRRSNNAAEAMAKAMAMNDGIVQNPAPANLPVGAWSFTSEEEKHRQTYQAFIKAATDYPGPNGDFGRYMAATHQLYFEPEKAEATLKELSQKDSEVGAQARLALANRYEAKGDTAGAIAEYQKLKAKPGTIPVSLIDLNLARVYETVGKTAEAADLYFAVASNTNLRNTTLASQAMTRLAVIAPDKAEQVPTEDPTAGGSFPSMPLPVR